MASNKQAFLDDWVTQRLALLVPDDHWQPDVNQALERLQRHNVSRFALRTWKWAAAAAVIAALALSLIAFPAPRVFAHYCLDCSVALLQSLSTPPPAHMELTPADERRSAPDFTLSDPSGKPLKLSGLRGKVVLLNFWATWCHGCATEIPWFIGFESAYKNRGFTAVGVSLDGDGWKSVKPYIAVKGVNYPIVIGTDAIANLYKVTAMPVTLLIDRNGKIAATHNGVINKDSYKAEIEQLLDDDSAVIANRGSSRAP